MNTSLQSMLGAPSAVRFGQLEKTGAAGRLSPFQPATDQVQIHFGKSPEGGHLDDFRKNGVAVSGGGGTMGSGIALNLLNTGIPVYLHDAKPQFVEGGVSKIQGELGQAVAKGIISQQDADQALALLKGKFSNDDVADIPANAAMVIEAIFENEEAKKALFKAMDANLGPDTILATNTSSLSVNDLAKATSRPDRFVGIHFFFPAHKNRFVEVIPGEKTSPRTVEKTKALVRALGKTPIVCNDSPGFVVNRMLVPVMNEGIRLWETELAKRYQEIESETGKPVDAETKKALEKQYATTIEQAIKETLWPTYSQGPFAGMLLGSFTGLNMPEYMGLIGEITQILHQGLGDAYTPAKTVLEKAAAFRALDRKDPEYQAKFDALKYQLGGPEDILQDKLPAYKDLFQGLVIGIATQLLDEGVTSPEDVNRGVMIGTQWETSPFELINKLGARKALDQVRAYQAFNPDFKVSETLKAHALKGTSFDLNYVETHKEGATQFITINKPQRNNALDLAMLNNIEKAFRAAEADPEVKTIVFESVGGKHFVSGADIFAFMDEVKEKTAEINARPDGKLTGRLPKGVNSQRKQLELYRSTVRPFLAKGYALYNEIADSKKVTVAKVNGTALGGGSELALACDYIVAGDEASFGLPEVKYGIYPAWGGTERLAQRVGPALASFMVLEGGLMDNKGRGDAILDAKNAQSIGLVDRVVPTAELDQAVNEAIADGQFAQKPSRSRGDAAEVKLLARLNAKDGVQSRLLDKLKRYRAANLDDVFANELKGLYGDSDTAKAAYRKVAELAAGRVRRGKAPNRITQERELFAMVQNMQRVSKLKP